MRAIGGLWRWRHNPLRRATDLAEAWVALAALLLILLAAPVVGAVVGAVAQDACSSPSGTSTQPAMLVTATVVRKLAGAPAGARPRDGRPARACAQPGRRPTGRRRTAPRSTARSTASLKSPHRGDHFTIWTDRHGPPGGPPAGLRHRDDARRARRLRRGRCSRRGLVEGGRRLIVWRMVRRRYARWDQAWDRAGPDWGRTGTGS